MSPDESRRFELELKADRVLYRLSIAEMSYAGDGFPWTVTDTDLADRDLVDEIRQLALGIGYRAASIAAGNSGALHAFG